METPPPKKICILMLAHNGEKYIGASIESVFAQKHNYDFELLISEDGSTDRTAEMVKAYQSAFPGKIRMIRNERNLGMSLNYMAAFKQVNASYIAFLDCDDLWTDPAKLQKQISFLETHPDYTMVYSDCNTIDEEGRLFDWPEMHEYRKLFCSGHIFFPLLRNGPFIPMLTTCVRAEPVLSLIGNKSIWFFEDWWLWFSLAIDNKFYYLNERTASYRLHPDNITKTRVKDTKARRRYLTKSINIYYSVLQRFETNYTAELEMADKELIFKRYLGVMKSPLLPLHYKIKVLPKLLKYFPGARPTIGMFAAKWKVQGG